ncbi:Sad1-interacting factor 3 [Schizosaccharomyces pombe 972h-] [Rhizoctonia solani]|uniref:Sad1-interacting factor 3 [Schizosaccharomyces pombe 972h-] n=1 Tax=Rhizoctonia solani TaxID=456999 RepID=A0A0K6G5L6_9AGAM|nr:Sad1-interacting factor 3 [Schizosaccharomyces pombe 972h-] [Rhizoctonia solani]
MAGLGRLRASHLPPIPETRAYTPRRPTTSLPLPAASKPQRTSKTSQKLVVLPSDVQVQPLPRTRESPVDGGEGPSTLGGELRSEGERMSKEQRQRAGYRRLTAYCVADAFRMKLLSAFLKREHGVAPRVFDEAVYAVYHLPLLPGYGQHVNIRSSPAVRSPGGKSILSKMSEAEEYGYDGNYFVAGSPGNEFSLEGGGYISSSPPTSRKPHRKAPRVQHQVHSSDDENDIADVIFFDYGVVVFFGLDETQEQDILEDLHNAGILQGRRSESDWEMEECHYEYDRNAPSPRIYNDFFTFKSSSHLLKLSLAHALAQSTLLAHYESIAQIVLAAPSVTALPKQLAESGELKLRRGEALKLTGRLFKLRRDVNLVSNVLDTPELFWSEASLKSLYDATRDYFEIEPRVQVLNERLGVASDLLDIIHEHLNNGAMMRITWIIIWLIVVACLVDLGEVLARLVVHIAQPGGKAAMHEALQSNSIHDATLALEKLMQL